MISRVVAPHWLTDPYGVNVFGSNDTAISCGFPGSNRSTPGSSPPPCREPKQSAKRQCSRCCKRIRRMVPSFQSIRFGAGWAFRLVLGRQSVGTDPTQQSWICRNHCCDHAFLGEKSRSPALPK